MAPAAVSRADAIAHRAGERRRHDGEPGDGADDEARDAEAEAAAVVEVDDLERQDPP
jgi:hypothetical protein